jgi:hypothetical protein
MAASFAIGSDNGCVRRDANRVLLFAVSGVLSIVLLLPMWWWPLVASQDGPSHLYNAAVINECLSGQGPSSTVYEVDWRPLPNWAGSLLAMVLLKILPLSIVPCVMLSITGVAPVLATLCLRRQIGRRCGFLWAFALAGCLATGRTWVLGFESFCLGTAAAIGVIALHERYRERLDLLTSLAIVASLTVTFFCHLVPWAFAAGTIGILSFTGPAPGRSRRVWWTIAILLAASPWLFFYLHLSPASRAGLELDWRHLEGFHPAEMKSWLKLLGRADCINVIYASIPFTGIRVVNSRPGAAFWTGDAANSVVTLILTNPMVLMAAAIALQVLRTAIVDLRSKDYRRIGWLTIGCGGILLALFMPDGTLRNGDSLPFRVMLLSLTMLIVYVRFDAGRLVSIATGILIALGYAFHAAAVWDYAATANRQLLETREAAATIPAGGRLYQIGTKRDLRFRADPVLHSEAYVALWSRGILLSNYEAAHYYFPVKLRAADPQSLVQLTEELQCIDLKRSADQALVNDFLSTQKQYIDVLIVRTVDQDLISLAQRTFSEVLWRSDDLCVLTRPQTAMRNFAPPAGLSKKQKGNVLRFPDG